MDLVNLGYAHRKRKGLLSIERLAVAYGLFTTLLVFFNWGELSRPAGLLLNRLLIAAGLAGLWALYQWRTNRLTFFLRIVYQVALVAYWYPDIYEFCRLLPYQDHIFATLDQEIFGCQPALLFSEAFSSHFWHEIFNLGYFSYYLMIVAVVVSPFFLNYHRFEQTTFILVASFFCYYVIYLFLPVAGPQYYYQAVGLETIGQGIFPPVGHAFAAGADMLSFAPAADAGFFQNLVEGMQRAGEHPEAAFPSSHVGLSTIILFLAAKIDRRLLWSMVPFYVLLCCSTVYIRAHYLVDVFGGWATAFLFYYFTHWLYRRWPFHATGTLRNYHHED